MKIEQKRILLGGLSIGLVTLGLIVRPLLATQAPGLTIGQLSSNQFKVTITNADMSVGYQLDRRLILDAAYPWTPHLFGSPGVTNFTVEAGIQEMGFIRAQPCLDCDQDGVPNWADAQPYSAATSNLVVIIDSPLNGATIQ